MNKICERCKREFDSEKAEKRNLTQLYLNNMSVDICSDCDQELINWLNFTNEDLKKYDICKKEQA